MATWEYNRGQWSHIEDPFGDNDVDTCLKEMGFENRTLLGVDDSYSLSAEIWEAKEDSAKWQFVIFVQITTGRYTPVFVVDLPSMIMFLKDFQPLASHGLLQDFQGVLSTIIDKVFHAWHGHGWEEACRECDPDQVKATRRILARRRDTNL
jgi:hypothetical protein